MIVAGKVGIKAQDRKQDYCDVISEMADRHVCTGGEQGCKQLFID